MANPQESLQGLSQGDFSTLDALKNLVAVTYEASGLDPQTFILVRMAALATLDAAPASWLMNIAVGGEAGLSREQLLGGKLAVETAPGKGTRIIVEVPRKH